MTTVAVSTDSTWILFICRMTPVPAGWRKSGRHDGRDGADNVLWDNVSMLYGLGISVRVPE